MLDGDSPYVRVDASSTVRGVKPEDVLLDDDGSRTCWEPEDDDELPSLTLTILAEGSALVTDIRMSLKGVSMVEVSYLPGTFSPVS